jgi:hypothetical protein
MPRSLTVPSPDGNANPHNQYLAAVEDTFDAVDKNFDALYALCETADEKQSLRSVHAAARDAYWRAVASALRDGSPFVREIYDDLTQTNQKIRELMANLQNASAFLSLVKQAVRLAASLVTLATAV